jgi:hypothetical protein
VDERLPTVSNPPTLLKKQYTVAYLVKSIVSISLLPVFRESSDRSEEL